MMPAKLNALHPAWERFQGLRSFYEIAGQICRCNQGKDRSYGEWYYAPSERLSGNFTVIYFGSWDKTTGQRIDAPALLHAEIFNMDDEEDAVEYTLRLQHWQAQPEYDQQPG